MSIKCQGHSLTLVKGHSDFKLKCLTFGLYTQVSDSGPSCFNFADVNFIFCILALKGLTDASAKQSSRQYQDKRTKKKHRDLPQNNLSSNGPRKTRTMGIRMQQESAKAKIIQLVEAKHPKKPSITTFFHTEIFKMDAFHGKGLLIFPF